MLNLVLAFSLTHIKSELVVPGFSNPVYPAYGYTGSRVLETNYTSNAISDIVWTQSATVDSGRGVYLAHPSRHSIIYVNATQKYRSFPVEGRSFAGQPGFPGHRDGTLASSLLNSPKGIAYYKSESKEFVFVADTDNHCIRRIDVISRRIITIAGIPGKAGHRDGDGRKALFNRPTSVGVDNVTGTVFVLDNQSVVRMLNFEVDDGSEIARVDSLVGGACRLMNVTSVYETIQMRTVRCQTDWIASSTGSSDIVDSWAWPELCLGNSVTCSTRYDEL
jgi:hypothetical protein